MNNPSLLNPLILAFLGDAVFELLVRGNIVSGQQINVNNMHKNSVKYVCSNGQSEAIEIIIDLLTEKEYEIYKRGRNTNGNSVPKNADIHKYRKATGIETLFGYLYLKKDIHRINELFSVIWKKLNS